MRRARAAISGGIQALRAPAGQRGPGHDENARRNHSPAAPSPPMQAPASSKPRSVGPSGQDLLYARSQGRRYVVINEFQGSWSNRIKLSTARQQSKRSDRPADPSGAIRPLLVGAGSLAAVDTTKRPKEPLARLRVRKCKHLQPQGSDPLAPPGKTHCTSRRRSPNSGLSTNFDGRRPLPSTLSTLIPQDFVREHQYLGRARWPDSVDFERFIDAGRGQAGGPDLDPPIG